MKPSAHDKEAEKIRDKERDLLIEHYTLVAAQNSEEYGFLNVRGHEVPDPTVVDPPLGYVQQPDLMELTRRMVQGHLSAIAAAQEFETLEEADDFDVDDDPVDYQSPWELYFDPAPGTPAGPPGDATRADPNAMPVEPPPAATDEGGGGSAASQAASQQSASART